MRSAIAFAVLLAFGNVYAQNATTELLPIPFPNTTSLEEEPSDILREARAQFERAVAKHSGRELGVAYGRLGMVYQNWQFHPATEAAYRNAIVLVPDDAHWPYYLALHFEETGKLQQAISFYQQSLDLDPGYANTWLRMAEVLLELNHLPAAQRGYEAALKLNPGMAAAYAGIGTVALRNEDYARAIEFLTRALQMQPEANQLNYRLAQAYRKTGDVEKARAYLAKSGRRIASAPDPWVDIMKTRAHPPAHFVDLGENAMGQRDFQTAAQNFNIAVTMDPDNVYAYVRLAVALRFLNRNEGALAAIDTALALEPDGIQALLIRGSLLETLDRFEDASAPFRKAVDLDRENLSAIFALANNLMRNGQYSEAAQNYESLRQARDNDVTARYWMGLAFTAAGRCDLALQPLAEAIRLQPGILELTMAQARVTASCAAANVSQKSTALQQAEQLLSFHNTGDHLETLAMALAATEQYARATDMQVLAIDSGSVRGGNATLPFLRRNLERYKNRQPADKAWADDSPVYFPPLPRTE